MLAFTHLIQAEQPEIIATRVCCLLEQKRKRHDPGG